MRHSHDRGGEDTVGVPPPYRQGRCLNSNEEGRNNDREGGIKRKDCERKWALSSLCHPQRTHLRAWRMSQKTKPSPPSSLRRQTIIVTSRWNAALCTGNLTFRRVRVTTVAVQKQYYIFWVCVCILALVTGTQISSVLRRVLLFWGAAPCQHYCRDGRIFGQTLV